MKTIVSQMGTKTITAHMTVISIERTEQGVRYKLQPAEQESIRVTFVTDVGWCIDQEISISFTPISTGEKSE